MSSVPAVVESKRSHGQPQEKTKYQQFMWLLRKITGHMSSVEIAQSRVSDALVKQVELMYKVDRARVDLKEMEGDSEAAFVKLSQEEGIKRATELKQSFDNDNRRWCNIQWCQSRSAVCNKPALTMDQRNDNTSQVSDPPAFLGRSIEAYLTFMGSFGEHGEMYENETLRERRAKLHDVRLALVVVEAAYAEAKRITKEAEMAVLALKDAAYLDLQGQDHDERLWSSADAICMWWASLSGRLETLRELARLEYFRPLYVEFARKHRLKIARMDDMYDVWRECNRHHFDLLVQERLQHEPKRSVFYPHQRWVALGGGGGGQALDFASLNSGFSILSSVWCLSKHGDVL
jgi:hypothetical protein